MAQQKVEPIAKFKVGFSSFQCFNSWSAGFYAININVGRLVSQMLKSQFANVSKKRKTNEPHAFRRR